MPNLFLAAAEATVTTTGMEAVIAAMSDVFSLMGTVITQITSQPILLFCLAAGLVPIGIKIFGAIRGAASRKG